MDGADADCQRGKSMSELLEPILSRADVRRALDHIRAADAETLADMRRLVRVPAPTGAEAARADVFAAALAGLGIVSTRDAVGNVIAPLTGAAGPAVVAVAHLDTVFDAAVDVEPREAGGRIAAPGIADNTRGLAGLLALARAVRHSGLRTARPVVLVASVGEEGAGDLRGVKYLFREGSPHRAATAVVALDGAGLTRIVHRAVGARRLRAVVRGPGGHSWADRGVANPVHAVAAAAARIADHVPVADAAINVTRIGGGESINAIPAHAWLELDLRSGESDWLAAADARARTALADAVDSANRSRRAATAALTLSIEVIGDRPTGTTPADTRLVLAAMAATRHVGAEPELTASSTDANVPIALGIPAIALGAGGESGMTHTLGEWYDNRNGPEGLQRALLTVLALAEPVG
jgi:tripeptide aminopeptidase